jgi:hypothetical protein
MTSSLTTQHIVSAWCVLLPLTCHHTHCQAGRCTTAQPPTAAPWAGQQGIDGAVDTQVGLALRQAAGGNVGAAQSRHIVNHLEQGGEGQAGSSGCEVALWWGGVGWGAQQQRGLRLTNMAPTTIA